jgi:Skp family chaperone for outer membrane proteins
MNKIILICLLSLLFSSKSFAVINVKEIEEVLVNYAYIRNTHIPEEQALSELKNIRNEIDTEIQNDPSSPVLWYLKGLNSWGYVYAYSRPLTDEKRKIVDEYKLVNARNEFRRSVELNENSTHQLRYENLQHMQGRAPADVDIMITRKMLEVGNLDDKEKLRERRRIVKKLIYLDRYGEARAELDAIENDFKKYFESKGVSRKKWHDYFKAEIQKKVAKSKIKATEQEKATEPAEPKKPEPVVTAPKQQPVVKEEKTHPKEEVLPESNNNKIYIISIVLAILLLVGFVVTKRKKK